MRKQIAKGYYIDSRGFVYSEKGRFPRAIRVNTNSHGYAVFKLWIDGKTKNFQLHRELARAFIPNPKNLPCINHKDGNKYNNDLKNLEWCTYTQNLEHAYNLRLRKDRGMSGEKYVSLETQTDKWRVSVRLKDGRIIKGSRHKTVQEAVAERDKILLAYA